MSDFERWDVEWSAASQVADHEAFLWRTDLSDPQNHYSTPDDDETE